MCCVHLILCSCGKFLGCRWLLVVGCWFSVSVCVSVCTNTKRILAVWAYSFCKRSDTPTHGYAYTNSASRETDFSCCRCRCCCDDWWSMRHERAWMSLFHLFVQYDACWHHFSLKISLFHGSLLATGFCVLSTDTCYLWFEEKVQRMVMRRGWNRLAKS
jgi:hypothetical protein